ncbi:hypothetical protein E2C01_022842 [Portunus trituberculatus]|uniref:Uncharacterized protein n=1 Tax=Portunus trituberculatus TaxID=210409 RepID=A0A5B7E6H3_PORTR|nr:hypothetical protein [Portunus trituberculatus]
MPQFSRLRRSAPRLYFPYKPVSRYSTRDIVSGRNKQQDVRINYVILFGFLMEFPCCSLLETFTATLYVTNSITAHDR